MAEHRRSYEGTTYTLSAYAVADGETQFALATYGAATSDATARGSYLGQGQFTPGHYNSGWAATPYEYSYTCDAANAGKYLQVAVYGWGSQAYWFDNVSVVPEPASMVLVGFGGLIGLARKRRR